MMHIVPPKRIFIDGKHAVRNVNSGLIAPVLPQNIAFDLKAYGVCPPLLPFSFR